MKLWKTNDPHFIITKKCQKQFRGPFFIFWVLTERGRLEAVQRPRRTVGPNVKNPSKMRLKIFMKLTQIILVPLTIWQVLIRKRKLFENAETCLEKLVKSLWVNLFLAVLSHLESSVRGCAKGEHEVNKLLETIISIGFGSKMSTNVKRVGKHWDQTHYPRLLAFPWDQGARDMLSTTVHSGHII